MTRGYGLTPEVGSKIFVTCFTAFSKISGYQLVEVLHSHEFKRMFREPCLFKLYLLQRDKSLILKECNQGTLVFIKKVKHPN